MWAFNRPSGYIAAALVPIALTILPSSSAFHVSSAISGARFSAVRHVALRPPRAGLPARSESARCPLLALSMSTPSPQEAEQEALIKKMLETEIFNLPQLVSNNIKDVSTPAFFMKIATMADAAEDEEQKKKLSTLADNVVATLEAVVERTTEKLDEASEVVQDILKKAAEENGEFALPLKAERLAEMRAEVRKNADSLDEGVISTIFAYMKKANEDGLDGMVLIFQKVLQLYASEELLASKPGDKVLEELLAADSDSWDGILARAMGGETDKDTLLGSVQRSVEKVVLQKASGSYGQRVQAEFLRELMGRIRAADEAQGGGSTSGDAEA